MASKILLVEDDNNLREIYEARLQAEGYTIVTAKDGEEALVVAKAEKPDLIISDVMMPRISGFEMLDILRNTEELKYTKVIMLTALGQADDKTRADSLGADRYLVKSQVTLEDIVKAAHELTDAAPAPAAGAVPAVPAATPTATTVPVAEPPVEPPAVQAVPVAMELAQPPATASTPEPAVLPVTAAPAAAPVEPAAPAPAAVLSTTAPTTPIATPASPIVVIPPTDTRAPVATPAPAAGTTTPAPATAAPTVEPALAISLPAPAPAAPVPSAAEPAATSRPSFMTDFSAASSRPAAATSTTAEPASGVADTAPLAAPSPAPEPSAAAGAALDGAASSADEKATVGAQIADFANAPTATTASPNSQDTALDDAVQSLSSDTAKTEPAATPAPTSSNSDGVTISGKKVIQPIPGTPKPDLNELLAREEAKEASPSAFGAVVTPTESASPSLAPTMQPSVPPAGPTAPHNDFDPNNIAL